MDLFTYAAGKQADPPRETDTPEHPPPEEAAPPAPDSDLPPAVSEPAPPLFHRSVESGKPLTGVLDPLTRFRIPLWADPDRKQRIIRLSAIGSISVLILILGIATWWSGRTRPAPVADIEIPSHPGPAAPRATVQAPAAATPFGTGARDSASATPPTARSSDAWALKAPGAVVKTQGGVKIVTFESGLFAGGLRLGAGGRRSLDALGRQLAPYRQRLSITVIGCTDNVPINLGGRYDSNQELGLARAQEVASHLQRVAKIPASSFQTLSYGERWTPYPNDTAENRARNRTAVLRISLR